MLQEYCYDIAMPVMRRMLSQGARHTWVTYLCQKSRYFSKYACSKARPAHTPDMPAWPLSASKQESKRLPRAGWSVQSPAA